MTGEVLLIQPKLLPPPVPAYLVPRPHLYRRLDAGLDGRVTLVSAPAGAGKTTLLSAWIRRDGSGTGPIRFGWLSLDPADNDLPHFLAHLAGAIHKAIPDLHLPTAAGPEAVLIMLANALSARDDRLVQILDDYHLIEAKAVRDALSFFLDHLPHNAHLVISTRAEPPLPLARLQGRGQSTRLGYADLCFSRQEVESLLRQMGVDADDGTVARLISHTEGWAAGVTLEATAIHDGAPDAGKRAILDYFQHEVLAPQPPERHEFLLRTAILDRLTAPLCDLLAAPDRDPAPCPATLDSQTRSQALLERLEADNLFVRAQDPQKQWYRYHPLLAELLRRRLEQSRPELAVELHRRAADWHEAAGLLDEAISHALAAGEANRAAGLVERALEQSSQEDRLTAFVQWIESLPTDGDGARPRLAALAALAVLLRGRAPSVAGAHLATGESALLALNQASNGVHARFTAELITQLQEVLNDEDAPPVPAAAAQPGEELHRPLTPRELEVLRLLATPLSPEDIAERLFVAVSTVRSHTKSIYAKLHVHRRLDAVQRARELKLIH
ncbi:MAG TPA: LuxR C-terminal-related transcriptional regulator [Anaerolineae bacterium]|nr:LuxR C-terminal-related transcriptional regulator [Anaerolineae bacterium]